MQRQVQEGVELSALGREFTRDRLRVFQQRLVLGVQQDEVSGHVLHRREHFPGAVLAPAVNEKTANLVAGGIEHVVS